MYSPSLMSLTYMLRLPVEKGMSFTTPVFLMPIFAVLKP
jgi:hypothetical protein